MVRAEHKTLSGPQRLAYRELQSAAMYLRFAQAAMIDADWDTVERHLADASNRTKLAWELVNKRGDLNGNTTNDPI